MAKIKVINPTITSDLVTDDFANTPSSLVQRIGDFSITTNYDEAPVRFFGEEIESISKTFTLDSITKDLVDEYDLDIINNFSTTLKFNFDKGNLSSYAYFGSMVELLRVTVENIVKTFPFSISINMDDLDNPLFSVVEYSYDYKTNKTHFGTNVVNFNNPSNISYVKGNTDTSTGNLNNNYKNFVIYKNGELVDYPIIGFTGSSSISTGFIYFDVVGNPFPDAISGNRFESFEIKPNLYTIDKYKKTLKDLEAYFLSEKDNDRYIVRLQRPIKTQQGYIFQEVELFWNTDSGYNLDVSSAAYEDFIRNLLDIGAEYDSFKTDLIYRMLAPKSITEYDLTEEEKMKRLLRIYGREFDEIKRFVDSLVFINNVTYNKKNNIPDLLIENLAKTLGWEYFDIVGEKDLIKNFFNLSYEDTKIPSEINIELWRRIIINTNFFWKNKGTRAALNALFELVGVPEALLEINEHIYLVEGKISLEDVVLNGLVSSDNIDLSLFVSEEGYPIMPQNTPVYFQPNGNEDAGQFFIDYYRQAGFKVKKVIDNRKVWANDKLERVDEITNTNYSIEDSNLMINTKEITINLTPTKLLEYDVYQFNKEYNTPINSSFLNAPYPQIESVKVDVQTLTFAQYVQFVYERFIDAKNRKILYEYPTLKQLLYDYGRDDNSKKYQFRYILKYSNIISTYWDKFIKQLLPATAIVTEKGIKINNSVFDTEKFTYKRGINDGSEFQVEQKEPTIGIIEPLEIVGSRSLLFETTINSYQLSGSYSTSFTDDFSYKDELGLKASFNGNLIEYNELNVSSVNQCKIDSNIEVECIHFYDNELSGRTINFSVNGSDNDIVVWDLFSYDANISGFTDSKVYTTSIILSSSTTNYSFVIPNLVMNEDVEYLLKPHIRKNITYGSDLVLNENYLDYYGNFNNNIYPSLYGNSPIFFNGNNIGTENYFINTEDIKTTYPYRKYNDNTDYYFVSLGNPLEPIITLQGEINVTEQFLKVENIELPFSGQTVYLSLIPSGDVEFSYDGTILTKDVDYSATTDNTTYELLFNIDDNTPHYLQASYLSSTGNLALQKEIHTVTSINSGTTNNNSSKIMFNTGTNYYEYSTDFEISSLSNFKLIFNGSILTNGVDFTISSVNNRIIVLYFNVSLNDNFMVFYATSLSVANILSVATNPFLITWDGIIPYNDISKGYFKIQIADYPDINFTGSIIEYQVDYIEGERYYSYRPSVGLYPANSIKIIRIANIKKYETIGGSIVESVEYSNSVLVRIPL